MPETKGKLSIDAQNLLPIIKKWLYSDKDIFIRELVANGCDAIVKYKALCPDTADALRVTITCDKEKGTISFTDNGVGMTAEEIEKYINRVAFSGAQEFIEKLKATGAEAENIIGHFGLGFYSAFMISDAVTIDTLSWQEGAQATFWRSEGGLEFEMRDSARAQRGTTVTLFVSQDEKEYLDEAEIRRVAGQYLNFMPIEIYIGSDEKPVNDTRPLYLKAPAEVTDEEYRAFYKSTFGQWEDPLFWVHLNIDYPFTLRGILYFPKIDPNYRLTDGCVKLYCRQVFVAENIKEIIPEYLLLLKGVIDSPDIPLNVSRSFLQNDREMKKLSAHISRKAADRLVQLCENERERYENVWDDIALFVKYGCLRDEKFYDRVKDALLFRVVGGGTLLLPELKEKMKEAGGSLFYVGEENRDAPIVELYQEKGVTMLRLDTNIDLNFIPFLEYKDNELHFKRVDSEVAGDLASDATDEDTRAKLEEILRRATDQKELKVELKRFEDASLPAMLLMDEQMRRFKDSNAFFGGGMEMPIPTTLTLNAQNSLVTALLTLEGEEQDEMARQIFDLAELAQGQLSKQRMTAFIRRCHKFMGA